MRLVRPNESHSKSWEMIIKEFEDLDERVFPQALFNNTHDFTEWLRIVRNYEHGVDLKYHHVPASFYFLENDCSLIVGAVDIRHYLSTYLENKTGHIGFSIRPSERRKGYGVELLKLSKLKADELGIKEPFLACPIDSEIAEKTIIKSGGCFVGVFEHEGKIKRKYRL